MYDGTTKGARYSAMREEESALRKEGFCDTGLDRAEKVEESYSFQNEIGEPYTQGCRAILIHVFFEKWTNLVLAE